MKCENANIIIHAYNTHKTSMNFVWFIPKKIEIVDDNLYPLTLNGKQYEGEYPDIEERKKEEYKKWSLGEMLPKGLSRVTLNLKKIFDLYCVHPGLLDESKYKQTEMMHKIILTRREETNNSVIIGGDFNSFIQGTNKLNQEQIDILSESFKWCSSDFDCTFCSRPWDILYKCNKEEKEIYLESKKKDIEDTDFKEVCEKLCDKYGNEGTALDHVFCSNDIELKVKKFDFKESDHSLIFIYLD
jgi:endonuclease/exonuclease/phosphatase family metal-dependent hydrolase